MSDQTLKSMFATKDAIDALGIDSDAWKAVPIRRAYVIIHAWLNGGIIADTVKDDAYVLSRVAEELEAAYHAVTFERIGRVHSGEFEAIEEEWIQQERDRQIFRQEPEAVEVNR
jgi:hypothetical protein